MPRARWPIGQGTPPQDPGDRWWTSILRDGLGPILIAAIIAAGIVAALWKMLSMTTDQERLARNGPLQGKHVSVPDGMDYIYERQHVEATWKERFRYSIDSDGETMSLSAFDIVDAEPVP